MRLFAYYALHSFKNQLKKLLKTWVLIFLAVCVAFGVMVGLIAAAIENHVEETKQEELVQEEMVESEPEEEVGEETDYFNTIKINCRRNFARLTAVIMKIRRNNNLILLSKEARRYHAEHQIFFRYKLSGNLSNAPVKPHRPYLYIPSRNIFRHLEIDAINALSASRLKRTIPICRISKILPNAI